MNLCVQKICTHYLNEPMHAWKICTHINMAAQHSFGRIPPTKQRRKAHFHPFLPFLLRILEPSPPAEGSGRPHGLFVAWALFFVDFEIKPKIGCYRLLTHRCGFHRNFFITSSYLKSKFWPYVHYSDRYATKG